MDDDRSFADLIASISHELRSPLTAVKGFSATLVERWDRFSDEQRQQFVATILTDADRMGRIVGEVIDLARVQAGRLDLRLVPAELSDVVQDGLAELRKRRSAVEATVNVPTGLTVDVDRERVASLIAGLVENGLKFSEDVPVEIEAHRDATSVVLLVRDHGVGIEADRLERVFLEPAPRGQMAGPNGSGLGLYLAHRMAAAHGGRLKVTSAPGRGSTFSLTLPLAGDSV